MVGSSYSINRNPPVVSEHTNGYNDIVSPVSFLRYRLIRLGPNENYFNPFSKEETFFNVYKNGDITN
jgi:hypothetical protein